MESPIDSLKKIFKKNITFIPHTPVQKLLYFWTFLENYTVYILFYYKVYQN